MIVGNERVTCMQWTRKAYHLRHSEAAGRGIPRGGAAQYDVITITTKKTHGGGKYRTAVSLCLFMETPEKNYFLKPGPMVQKAMVSSMSLRR